MAKSSVEALRSLYEALARGDPEAAVAQCTDDFVLEDVALGRAEGKSQAVERWRSLLQAFPGLTFITESEYAVGNVVVLEQTLTGRHLGEFMNVPPTGAPVRFRVAAVARCRRGRVATLRLYRDVGGFLSQFAFVVRAAVVAAILNRALPISLIVGTTFTLINQLSKILDGVMKRGDWIRMGFNYAVPFTVATVSALIAKPPRPGRIPGGIFGRLLRKRIARAIQRATQ
jgi:predicted ester cyclase